MAVRKISMAAETVKNNQLRRMSNETYTNRKRWHNTKNGHFYWFYPQSKANDHFEPRMVATNWYRWDRFKNFNEINCLPKNMLDVRDWSTDCKWLGFWSKGVFEDFDKVQKLESILNERI